MLAQLIGFAGANLQADPRFLPDGVGVSSTNQKPGTDGNLRPWREPLTLPTVTLGASRKTLYRMGRDTASTTTHWLSWTTIVHAIRGFDTSDTTERTYFTGDGVPKWTDNIQALASAPYPTASRLLAVPQPTLAPTATLDTDGATGDARALYYVFTWVNDIGWESAPSPPVLAVAAKPGATFDLSISESVPSGSYGVNRVRWYRTEEVGTTADAEYFFLREYSEGAIGMQDDGRDLTTADGPLPTETWLPLDDDATWLTECWNQFAGAIVGKAVRFCEPNYIYAWPFEYEYAIAGQPLALASFAQRLLVLTDQGAEVLTGSHPEELDQKPLALAAIVSPTSLVVGDTYAMWAAADGLWYYGVDAYRCLTAAAMTPAQWAALVPSTMHGHFYTIGDRVFYVGFYNDGAWKGIVVDPLNPNGVYFLETGYPAAYWDTLLRTLFVLDGTTLKQWDAGAAFMTATFKGKVHRQVAYTEAEWLEILGEGSTTTKLHTDATTPFDRAIASGEYRLPDGTGAREFQLEVSTQGAVTGVTVE